MKNLIQFEGNNVEVFEYEGKILFNPYDVGRCLDIKNIRDNLSKMNENQVIYLKNSDVGNADFRKLNNRGENFLTESGVYKLIFKSRKQSAERFSDWVTDEVLPIIRKTGKYSLNTNQETDLNTNLKKYYNGKPVMVIRDLKPIFGLYKHEINYHAVTYNIGTLLEGHNLIKFKNENPNINMKFVSVIKVFTEEDILKFARKTRLGYDNRIIKSYFHDNKLSTYEKMRLVELARDIKTVANTRGRNTDYASMLNTVVSKIYADCGFLEEPTDDLSTHKPIGWNLQQPLIDFRGELKKKLV